MSTDQSYIPVVDDVGEEIQVVQSDRLSIEHLAWFEIGIQTGRRLACHEAGLESLGGGTQAGRPPQSAADLEDFL